MTTKKRSAAPVGGVSVSTTREEERTGSEIVLPGRIGGCVTSLTDKAVIAVLADENVATAYSDMPGDACARFAGGCRLSSFWE